MKKPENLNHVNYITSVFFISCSLCHLQSKNKLKLKYVNLKTEMLGVRSNKYLGYTERNKERET